MRRATIAVLVGLMSVACVSELQAQSFSVDAISPSVTLLGAKPDDIFFLAPAAAPVLPAPPLGIAAFGAELDALSYGRTLGEFSTALHALFSVDIGGMGVAGSAVAVESTAAEESSDVYFSTYGGTNGLLFDGDGLATAPNPAVPGLGVAEPVSYPLPPIPPPSLSGDVDAFDLRSPTPALTSPTGVIYFSLDAAPITGGIYGAGFSPADIFIGLGGPGFDAPAAAAMPPTSPSGAVPYATELALGFPVLLLGNDIDAVVVYDDGDGVYLPGTDIVVFSLKPGSPYIGTLDPVSGITISPGDILVDGMTAAFLLGAAMPEPAILHTAESLGLLTKRGGAVSDTNLNALDMVVPEPTSVVLVIVALISLLGYRRR